MAAAEPVGEVCKGEEGNGAKKKNTNFEKVYNKLDAGKVGNYLKQLQGEFISDNSLSDGAFRLFVKLWNLDEKRIYLTDEYIIAMYTGRQTKNGKPTRLSSQTLVNWRRELVDNGYLDFIEIDKDKKLYYYRLYQVSKFLSDKWQEETEQAIQQQKNIDVDF